ncbi:uncharacterized protein LOC121291627 [Carcharodon carcharias]|uniref:uncharacterized protein LOC121291627 n=1 Tax=Carcharodon carcharias TaxID=13397 RepID=UPI001B7E0E51|nr:uncharacterized protein LOC121291627 [Carcharodon carcharias]XP_041069015.1 uncharacterized protein LOC121291627 [Carcharodon carcharias]
MASPGLHDRGFGRSGLAEGDGRQRQRGTGRGRRGSRGLVQLGDQIHRWNRLKRQLNLQSDEEMARRLLDAFVKIHVSPSSPNQAVLQVCIRDEGVVTHGAIRKEQEDAHSTTPFWPSAAVGNERTHTSPPASWKMEVPSESKPRGKRSRSDRLARAGSSSSPDLPKAAPESEHALQVGGRVPLGRLPLPLEEATPGRPRRDGPRLRSRVFIGDQAARWNSLKADLGMPSDEEMARVLLDVFIEKRMNQPGPSCTVREMGLNEEADVTRDSVKEDNEQDDLDSIPSLSAGSESTVTLSHPSSIGSFEDDTDISLFSGADSLSESVWKSPGMASRRPECLALPNPGGKVGPEEWESDSEGHRFDHHNSKNRDPYPRNTEMEPTVPSEAIPERRRSSIGEIIPVCVGGGGAGQTCPAVKIEQEDLCSSPSPVASGGSESTVTLSHPSSDLSLEEDCQLGMAALSESETDGPETEAARRRKQPVRPGRNCGCERPGTLDIGEQIERWNLVKERLKLKSDEEMARALLDLYTKTHSISSSPLTTLSAFVKKV